MSLFFGTVGQTDPGIPSPTYALDATSGALKWCLIIPWDEYGFPSLAFNTIYVGVSVEAGSGSLLAIDEALTQLAVEDAEAAQLVKLRFYAGLSVEEAAEVLGLARATAFRTWNYAKAWLRTKLGGVASTAMP